MVFPSAYGEPFGGSGASPSSIDVEYSATDSEIRGIAFNADIGILFTPATPTPGITVGKQEIGLSLYTSPVHGFRFRADLVTASIELDSANQVFFQLE